MTTLKLLKCFHLCVPYASDVEPAVRGHDVWGWDYFLPKRSSSVTASRHSAWKASAASVSAAAEVRARASAAPPDGKTLPALK